MVQQWGEMILAKTSRTILTLVKYVLHFFKIHSFPKWCEISRPCLARPINSAAGSTTCSTPNIFYWHNCLLQVLSFQDRFIQTRIHYVCFQKFSLASKQGELPCINVDENKLFSLVHTVNQEMPCQCLHLFGAKWQKI